MLYEKNIQSRELNKGNDAYLRVQLSDLLPLEPDSLSSFADGCGFEIVAANHI